MNSVCSKCGLPVNEPETGIRHYGNHIAHSESRCIQLLKLQIDSLRRELETLVASASERPILFSGAMVNAILEGRKTQTRRIAGPPEILSENDWLEKLNPVSGPGDRLWVREAWAPFDLNEEFKPSEMHPQKVVYLADQKVRLDYSRYLPSIHMPRWASRITLKITSVRAERLQDITAADCEAEGIQIPVEKVKDPPVVGLLRVSGKFPPSAYFPEGYDGTKLSLEERNAVWLRAHYASLWDSRNAKKYPWSSNPWVWVIGFERVEER